MERFTVERRPASLPARLPGSQLVEHSVLSPPKEGKAGVRSSLVEAPRPCRGKLFMGLCVCVEKKGNEGRKERERKMDRVLVEARCTPQSRPSCLVAQSNQT